MRRSATRRLGVLLVGVVLIATMAITPGSALAEQTIALSTGTFELALGPGQSASDGLKVANNGDEHINALVYTADVDTDENGDQTYTRPEPDPQNYLSSPASWIRIQVPDSTKIVANTPYLEMEPGDEFLVNFELVVPRGATPGDYNAVIFFEMFEFDEGTEGAVSRVSGRIGARIDLRVVGSVVDDIKLQDFSARTFVIGDTTPFAVRVANEGNIDKKVSVRLALVGSGESEVWSKTLEEEANVYAQRDRFYDGAVTFDGVGLGKYTFRAEMNYNKEVGDEAGTLLPETDIVERQIWVIPLWFAILILIVVGLPIIYLTYRVSTRGKRAAQSTHRGRAEDASQRRPEDFYDPDAPDTNVRPRRDDDTGTSASGDPGEGQGELWASESMLDD